MKHPFSCALGQLFQEILAHLGGVDGGAPCWAFASHPDERLANDDLDRACGESGKRYRTLWYSESWAPGRCWAVVRHAAAHSLTGDGAHDGLYPDALQATYLLWRDFYLKPLPVTDLVLASRQLVVIDRHREGKL